MKKESVTKGESWSDQKEVSKSALPIYLSIKLVKILPEWYMKSVARQVSFFYFIFAKKARKYSLLFQRNLKEFTKGKSPKRVSAFKHILSFSYCLIEKIEGWSGKADKRVIHVGRSAFAEFSEKINNGEGVLVIASHLGNIELLRSVSARNENDIVKKVPVTCVMDAQVTSNFNQAIGKLNPDALTGIINPRDFGMDTIELIQQKIEEGHMVVITGDRTSINSPERNIPCKFLGKDTVLPYGPFFLSSLLKCPTYFMFGIRNNDFGKSDYSVKMIRSSVDFDCPRKERSERIVKMAYEYRDMLENICVEHPYQWYNFYDYWYIP